MIVDSVFVVVLLCGFLCCINAKDYIGPPRGFPLFEHENGRWRGRLSGFGRFYPPRLELSTNVQYDHTENLFFEGSGWVDTRGGYGVGVGVGYRFKRRAIGLPEDRFHLRVEASPCQFLVYDRNADGVITREEVHDVFPDENLAEKLFRDLDSTTDDNIITIEEFYVMAPKLINGCEPIGLNKARKPGESQKAEDSVTAEALNGETGETAEDHTEE